MAGYRDFIDMGYSSTEASAIMTAWESTYSSLDDLDTEATVEARVAKANLAFHVYEGEDDED